MMLRVPLVPELAGVLKFVQFSCEALKGAVGPRPPLMGLKAVPLPAGMEKQLAQFVPKLAAVPKPLDAGCHGAVVPAGAPPNPRADMIPRHDSDSGVLSRNPHGRSFE